MKKENKGLLRSLESILEIVILTSLYCATWKWGYKAGNIFQDHFVNGLVPQLFLYAIVVLVVFRNSECFQFGQLRITEVITGQIIGLLIVNVITYVQLCLSTNQLVAVWPMLVLTIVQGLAAVLLTVAYTSMYHRLFQPHNMLLVYGRSEATALKQKMDVRWDKYHVNHMISVEEGYEAVCREMLKYDAVVLNDIPAQIRNDILKFCYKNQIRSYVVPKLTDIIMRGAKENALFDTPLLLVKGTGLTLTQRFVKRAMDIVLCLIAMIVAAPVMLLIALAIKLEDGGPVFYKQERVTRDGKKFAILKFRSMPTTVPKDVPTHQFNAADMLSKWQKFIRRSSVDELPQIFNIFVGQMSICGPRPALWNQYDLIAERDKYGANDIRPGLTGWAQINGRDELEIPVKAKLDGEYTEALNSGKGFAMDAKCIIGTVMSVLKSDGVVEGGTGSMQNEEAKQEVSNNE